MLNATNKKIAERRAQLQQVCDIIVRDFQPEKIVLFGSYANGTPTVDSDLDLMVVLPFDGSALQKAVAILRHIDILAPLDLLVRTQEQIQQRLWMGDSFMRDVLERGKVLYEANHARVD